MRELTPSWRRTLRLSTILLLPIPAAAGSLCFRGCEGRVKAGGSLQFRVERLDGRRISGAHLEFRMESPEGRALRLAEGGWISPMPDGSLRFSAPCIEAARIVVIKALLPGIGLEGAFAVEVMAPEAEAKEPIPSHAPAAPGRL